MKKGGKKMKAIKALKKMDYEFILKDNTIGYRYKPGEAKKNQIERNVIYNLLLEIKEFKKCAIDYLKYPPKEYSKVVAFDIETSALRPSDGDIVLIAYADEKKVTASMDAEEFRSILEDKNILKVFHNAAFDVLWLTSKGYKVVEYIDTMIMSQVINNRVRQENSLADLAQKYLDVVMDKSLQAVTNWGGEISDKHIEYCKKDAQITRDLYTVLMNEIERLHLGGVLRKEMGALPAVIELRKNGIKFDYKGWEEVLKNYKEEKEIFEEAVKKELNDEEINLSSPKQLLEALHKVGVEITSTSDEELSKFEEKHNVIKLLRKYKKLKKKITSFGVKLKEKIDEDGCIRGSWNLIGADTSRMTCTKPNLQGMPRASKDYFVPRDGNVFIIADYSQIELRVLAQISKDPIMIQAFNNGEDLHSKTASMILNKPITEISSEERKIAKTANFGLIYGMTSYGLMKRIKAQYGMDISFEEAEIFRNGYFKNYKGVLDYQDKMLKADDISTLGGRYWSRETFQLDKGSIKRYNYPIQGTAAEGFKESLSILMNKKKKSWKLVAVVHDEIVLEVPKADKDEAIIILKKSMKEGMQRLIDEVPIEIDIECSNYWSKS